MPTHGSWVHVFTLQETPPPTYFILESPPRTRLVKVVFGIDREYVHIRSRSLCQPIVIITPRSFKNSWYFKTRIKFSISKQWIRYHFKTQNNMISFYFKYNSFPKSYCLKIYNIWKPTIWIILSKHNISKFIILKQ